MVKRYSTHTGSSGERKEIKTLVIWPLVAEMAPCLLKRLVSGFMVGWRAEDNLLVKIPIAVKSAK